MEQVSLNTITTHVWLDGEYKVKDVICLGDTVAVTSWEFTGYGIVREITKYKTDSCLHGGTTTSTYVTVDVLPWCDRTAMFYQTCTNISKCNSPA